MLSQFTRPITPRSKLLLTDYLLELYRVTIDFIYIYIYIYETPGGQLTRRTSMTAGFFQREPHTQQSKSSRSRMAGWWTAGRKNTNGYRQPQTIDRWVTKMTPAKPISWHAPVYRIARLHVITGQVGLVHACHLAVGLLHHLLGVAIVSNGSELMGIGRPVWI